MKWFLGSLLALVSFGALGKDAPPFDPAADAAVLRVTIAVAFADQSTSGGLFNTGSSVKSSAHLALVPDLTQILIVTPKDGKARVYLNEPILMAGDVLDLKETTTTGEKATQAVANVITGLLAGGGRSMAHYEAAATPEGYAGAVDQYGKALEAAMLNALRAGLTVAVAPPAAAPPP
jgi:hypothetical protein